MRKIRRWCIGALVVMIAFASGTIPGGRFASAAPGDNRAGFAGEGTALRPYKIQNEEQLFAFSLYQEDYVNAHLELTTDIDFAGWDWDARPWNPIGSSGGPFTGTFDGNGHAIHGLVVHLSEQSKVGMFGQVGIGGVLQRLSLIDANVEGKAYVGALAGDIREGTVENVSVTGTVQGSGERIGGLIGFTTRGFVLNSHAGADVTGTRYVGGLIGYSVSEIQASSASGKVSGESEVGGLVGINSDSVIRFSYATGDVFGSGNAGGLVGENIFTCLVEYSYATGDVSGTVGVGGLIGSSSNSSIVLNSHASGNVEGEQTIGGLVGDNVSTVQYSYAYGAVKRKTENAVTDIGGIVGANYGKVESSYWNSDANPGMNGVGVNENLGTSVNLTGLTEANFRQQVSFGWLDFVNEWTITEGETLPEPKPAVAEVDWFNRIEVKTGTAFADLPLPASVGVRLSDGSRETLSVAWSVSGYNGNMQGVYDVEGTLTLGGVISPKSPNKITVKVVVRNEADDEPVLVIHTRDQLYALSLYQDPLNANYALAADIDFAGWDWDARPWNPIGSNVSPFTGTFDGKGNTIRGLTVNRPDTSNTGMFGQIGEDSVIQRVSLIDANVKGQYSVGALAGYNERGTIRHVSVTGIVYGTDSHIGGVIGFSSFGNVSYAHADVDVTGTRFTGGLIGISSSHILASSARGNVRGTTEVGGLVGTLTNGTIRYSYASGDVFGTDKAIGGLVGESYHTCLVEYSYATGNVSGNSYVGGLIGNNNNQDTNVLNNYASGNVEGEDQVGGIVGRNLGTVQYSYAYGKVQGKTVHAEIGGIVGVNHKEVGFSYWNSDANPGMSGVGVNENLGTSANLTGLTEMAFRQQHSFAHFDFDQDWAIVEGVTTPYIKHPDADLTINEPDAVVELPGSGVLTVKGEIQTGASGDETFSIDYLVVNEDHVIVAEGSLQTGLEAGPFTINKPFTDVFPAAPGSRHTLWAWASAHATGTKPHSFSFVYPLPAPTGLTAIAGNRQVTLQWDPVVEAAHAVTYTVYQYSGASAPANPGDWTVAASGLTDPSFTVGGLQNGLPYIFAVAAHAGTFTSELSVSNTVVPSPNANAQLSMIQINGQDLAGFSPDTTVYTLPDFPYTTDQITVTAVTYDPGAGYTVIGGNQQPLEPNVQKTIEIKVTAENGNQLSYVLHVKRMPLPAPTGLSVTAGNRKATLQWDAITGIGHTVTYSVYQYNGVSAPMDPGDWTVAAGGLTDTSFTAVGLQNGSPYTFAVTAQAGMDMSELSTPVTVVLSSQSGSTTSPSADRGLRSLEIRVGETVLPLEPAFDPGTTFYTAHTDAERIELKLAANDYWATVRYEGTKVEGDLVIDLVPGEQELVFVVTAENGEERTYTIAITRHVPADAEEEAALAPFADTDGHWAERYIAEAVRRGIVSGYPDGTFRPDAPITRAEFTALVARVLQLPEPADMTPGFTDQARIGDWARKAIAQAAAAGIVSGFDDGSFRPDEPLTRQQMAVILARAMDLQLSAGGAASYADAADIAEWARAAVGALQELGFMIGRGDNRFHPQAMATRAEAVVVLLDLLLP